MGIGRLTLKFVFFFLNNKNFKVIRKAFLAERLVIILFKLKNIIFLSFYYFTFWRIVIDIAGRQKKN